MSDGYEYFPPLILSGAMYINVPVNVVAFAAVLSRSLEIPKSEIYVAESMQIVLVILYVL